MQHLLMMTELQRHFITTLAERETKTAAIIASIENLLIETRNAIDDMEASAARLPDGTLVFKDENGEVVYADGSAVESELAAQVEWRGNEPTLAEYQAAHDKLDRLEDAYSEWSIYQTDTLGGIRDRVNDPDVQHTADDFGDMLDDIDYNEPELPTELVASEQSFTAAPEISTASLALPDMGAKAGS